MASLVNVAVVLGDPRLPYSYSVDGQFGKEELDAVEHLQVALEKLDGFSFEYFDDHRTLVDDLGNAAPDLALNLCDTGFRNDWLRSRNVPALLEVLDIPYTGADPAGIVLSDDKALCQAAAALRGVPVPGQTFIDLDLPEPPLPASYPAILKPNLAMGSYGITQDSLVHDDEQARAQLERLRPSLEIPEVLAQEFLPGEEYTLGLIGNASTGFTTLPPLQIDYSQLDPDLPRILTYGSKADPDSPYWKALTFKRAPIDDITEREMSRQAQRLFNRIGLRDYARFDFREGADGKPRLIDANCNPTWYFDGKMALMASWAGYDYSAFLELILKSALDRYAMARAS